MKTTNTRPAIRSIRPLTLGVALAALVTSSGFAANYTMQLQPGPNLIANHLDNLSGNTLNTVFSAGGLPTSSSFYAWDVPSQQFNYVSYLSSGSTWTPNSPFNPRLGAALYLPGVIAKNILISGDLVTATPVTLTPGQYQLLGASTVADATFQQIVGASPSAGVTTWLHRYDAVNMKLKSFRYVGGTWTPPFELVPVGEGVFVGTFLANLAPPNIIAAARDCDVSGDFIRITFDVDVDPLTAADKANFTITGGAVSLTAAEPEFVSTFLPLPPKVRSVRLRVTGLTTPSLLTVKAPGVTGMGGTPVSSAAAAQVQTALTAIKASMDCLNSTLCLTFNQAVDHTAAILFGNYSVKYTDLNNSSLPPVSLSISSIAHTNNEVCLQLSAPPAGNLLFTVDLHSLVSVCGAPLAITPIFTISTKCNPVVEGRVFRHEPASGSPCVQDLSTGTYGSIPNEFGLANRTVKLDDGSLKYYGVTDAQGDFRISAPAGDGYRLDLVTLPGWTQRCPTSGNGYGPFGIVAGQTYSGYLFAAEPNAPVKDLSMWVYGRFGIDPFNSVRFSSPCCGQPMTLVGCYRNSGTEVVLGANVQLTLPIVPWVALQSTAATPSLGAPSLNLSSGVLTWTIPVLLPGQSGTVEANLMLTCAGGSVNTVSAAAAITTPAGDPTPTDNNAFYSQQTVCSHDPNDKTVRPRGCGPEGFVPVGTEFEYLIQFQNTGNGPAYRVILRDVLDADLDYSTLQQLDASHPCVLVFTYDPVTREMVWTMEGINLPGASYDEPGSHGFVRYKVKHNTSAPVGTVITNQTKIYFDVNEAVPTSITTNTLTSAPVPVAAFTASVPTPIVGQPIHFTYTGGTPGATFAWDFGPDATPNTSTAQNPSGVSYATPGPKLPTLKVALGGCEAEPTVALITVGPAPGRLNIQRADNNVTLSWTNAAFHLQATPALSSSAVWADVPGTSPVTVPIGTGTRFFRLVSP